ncbi:putative bifunctional diguanylate cyclase/phosphodiesterase [Spirilliplanes yamanashiensis]|uniref:Diguanylate cyclase/phosphodiesterase n=1 Tax=Spirilliplanes yamanashiensis TaxID=42233 RepID=A0A8J4DLB7_9ACTN|nr:bifunctional diguanylate cyclase/phosphodiesterase [Spirilliplanes yamanashiensis]MDP9816304.1 diguanylate cyclase (GGDEF)-like protein [Spirilliplanes yamanashiensis]GIJ05831.1 hypothetical protein Sya03_51830 [Spirilliplanes yamanashiensis]
MAWRWYLTAGLAVVGAGPFLPEVVQQAGYTVLGFSVLGAVTAGLRVHRPARPLAWRLLLVAMTVVVLANAGWAVETALGVEEHGVSVTDVVYLLMYPLIAACLAILPVQGRYGSRFAGMTEAGVITATATVLTWTLLIDPLVSDTGRLPIDAEVVAYPVLDLLILAMVVRMALVTGMRTRAHQLIAGTSVALLVADTVYFVDVAGGGDTGGSALTVAGWLLANTLVGAAALHPSMARFGATGPGERPPDRPVSLPVFVLLVLLSPVLTAVSLVSELRAGQLGLLDVLIPTTATMVTAVLLVVRLGQLTGVAQRRAVDLEALRGELSHRALHDPLTGLPNRTSLQQRLAEGGGALLMFDLDGFKDVNDRYGHPVGDRLLTEVAARVTALVPDGGMLARLGGDEFALVVPGDDALEVGAAILTEMRRPVDVQGRQLYATASVGLRRLSGPDAPAADGAEDAEDAEDAVRDADVALYAAKAAGKDCLVEFDDALRQEQLVQARTLDRVRGALAVGAFVVHYQPLVRLRDERIVGVEALVRWPTAGGMVPPDAFVPVAESSGLIVPLGEWVLRRACRDAAAWHRAHGTGLSVNVSPRQLAEPDFAAVVLRALADAGLPPAALTLEITENVLVGAGRRADRAVGHLVELRRHGVRVALDDFGTGYSSLAYLRDLPIDEVKVDRSFAPAGAEAGRRMPLVRAIVDLATALGLKTVAEGVEDAATADRLRGLGCDLAQGHHFAGALEAGDVPRLLTATGAAVPR